MSEHTKNAIPRLTDFSLGYDKGVSDAFARIRARSKSFVAEYNCYVIPAEALQDVDNADTEKAGSEYLLLSQEFKRWHKFAEAGDKTMYIAVTTEGRSYAVTIKDGEISSRSLLATGVEV
jgi:hypothetical protein